MIRSVCMEFLCICAHTCVGAVFVVWEGWRGAWPCGFCCECAHTYMCALFFGVRVGANVGAYVYAHI